MLVLRSPLEDPLSGKHVIPTKRRVQAFVLLAIVVFVAGGIAANRYVTAAHLSPPAPAPTDAVVPPSPESSAVRPAAPGVAAAPNHAPTVTTGPSLVPKALPRRHHTRPSRSASPSTAAASSKGAAAEAEAVRLTNVQRAKHGCSALRMDTHLRAAARAHSKDMHVHHYFAHNSQNGTTPWDRIKAAGYSSPGAENIAQGYPTAQAVLNAWMNSEGHRANILNCSLKAVGIGVEYGQNGPWWTQDFGFK